LCSKGKFVGLGKGVKFVVPKMSYQNEKESGRPRQQRQVSEGFDSGPNVNRRRWKIQRRSEKQRVIRRKKPPIYNLIEFLKFCSQLGAANCFSFVLACMTWLLAILKIEFHLIVSVLLFYISYVLVITIFFYKKTMVYFYTFVIFLNWDWNPATFGPIKLFKQSILK